MVFLGFGALIARTQIKQNETAVKKLGSITSGIGLILALVAGFGMAHKGGFGFHAGWVIAKIAIWVIIGALTAVVNRKAEAGKSLWWGLLVLGSAAAIIAIYKPF